MIVKEDIVNKGIYTLQFLPWYIFHKLKKKMQASVKK